ncbi:hypothetical protein SAMN04489867_1470 [Pedococcus dokdonensis]|uniref:Lipoprotein n=1 Tax=Pedococcus dokdonensis TaxID=443156 RepID=A0A1H0Q5S6_9MICO|nr:hypothetical protein [Pedococcus dokdonensis]SDP11969.1 hypothetical protein SAMN04489867_1470 [Pedococcus dokdonensis]
MVCKQSGRGAVGGVRGRTLAGLLGSLLTVAAVSGCGTGGEAASRATSVPPVTLPSLTRVTTAAQASASPFTEAFESVDELFAERDAYERLMQACTARYGYEFVPHDTYRPREQFFDLAQPYGPVDLATVRELGYHDPASLQGPPPAPMWEGSPTPARILVGRGEEVTLPSGAKLPDGGCDAESVRALGGERPQEAVELAGRVFVAADKDPQWGRAVRAWSDCMRAKGHRFTSSVEAVERYRSRPGRPSAEEKAVAVADVECKDSTREVDTLVAVLATHEAATIADHRDAFAEYARWRAKQSQRVRAVLASTPPPVRRYWLDAAGARTTAPPRAQ